MTELELSCPAPTRNIPRVLSIAGSDPSGGAGIQADLKSIAANGGYGMAAITALTAQNTLGVRAVHIPPVEFLRAQLDAVADDVHLDAVKIGMLGNAEVIAAVHRWLLEREPPIVVLDPVMVSSSGARLLTPDAEVALRALVAVADVVTPNIAELAVLVGEDAAQTWLEALGQGKTLAQRSQTLVLVKGGHLDGDTCADALVDQSGVVREFAAPRVATRNTHGTGCSTSAALATVVARTGDWGSAMEQVKFWLHDALATADELEVGSGHGPVNHFHELWQHMPPSGDAFSARVWAETRSVREEIFDLEFVKGLGDGTLPQEQFTYYLAQDALYLNAYSRVLARASALAPREEEQRFWAHSAHNALVVETQLHKDWLQGESRALGPVTKAYIDHLLAVSAQGSYGELVAAVLPCFWLYAHVGEVLLAQYKESQEAPATKGESAGQHPFQRWMETYSDPDFAAATRQAVNILDAAAAAGSVQERLRMRQAFADSARYERDFFSAPSVLLQ